MKTQHRILVTGGAGFIGSHTCKALVTKGFEPVCYDNLSTGNRDAVKWGPFVQGDVLDRVKLSETMRACKPMAVIHFAASAYVGESMQAPDKYYRNNVSGLLGLLDACIACDVTSLVFSSSCATYGVPASLPIGEESPQEPISPYGRTKLIGEQIIRDYARAYGMRFAILRYFNACGADPDGEIGEKHDPETHLIPLALLAATGIGAPLGIFGADHDTPDGTCIRDYIHVCDLALAHIRAVEYLAGGGADIALNLGTGAGLSIYEILKAISDTTGREVPFIIKDKRLGDPPVLYADPRQAQKILSFMPTLSAPSSIIASAAPFFGLRGAS